MESHAWLVSAFLCLIGLTAVFEGFSLRAPAPEVLVRMAAMVASGFIGWFSLKRYIALMQEAERFSRRPTCQRCRSYGKFEVLRELPHATVRCRKCGHEWQMD
jgi:hypothetical protein